MMKPTQGHSDTLISPIFSPGILLDAADLQQGVIYTQELIHLMMRHLFSPGVVCGLAIRNPKKVGNCQTKYTFTVEPGLALDDRGQPIHVPKPITIEASLDSNNTYFISIKQHEHASCRKEAQVKNDGTSDFVATRRSEGYEIDIQIESDKNQSGIVLGSISIDDKGTPSTGTSARTPILGKFSLAQSQDLTGELVVQQPAGDQGSAPSGAQGNADSA